jgi:hypothetical protein
MLVRADYIPGGSEIKPPQLNGAAAAAAPGGKVLAHWTLKHPTGRLTVSLVRVGGKIAFDETRGGTRVARVTFDDVDPSGRDIGSFAAVVPEDTDGGETTLDWLNPDGIEVVHVFGVLARAFDFYD